MPLPMRPCQAKSKEAMWDPTPMGSPVGGSKGSGGLCSGWQPEAGTMAA